MVLFHLIINYQKKLFVFRKFPLEYFSDFSLFSINSNASDHHAFSQCFKQSPVKKSILKILFCFLYARNESLVKIVYNSLFKSGKLWLNLHFVYLSWIWTQNIFQNYLFMTKKSLLCIDPWFCFYLFLSAFYRYLGYC